MKTKPIIPYIARNTCPFCGCKDTTAHVEIGNAVVLACSKCGASGPQVSLFREHPETIDPYLDAIYKWNTRK